MKNFKSVNPNDYRSLIIIDFCVLCGISTEDIGKTYLEVDHINSDHDDNRLENLQVLCKFCHENKTMIFNSNQGDYENFLRLLVIADADERVKSHLKTKSLEYITKIIRDKDSSLNRKRFDDISTDDLPPVGDDYQAEKDKLEQLELTKLLKEQQEIIDNLPENERRSFIEKKAYPIMKKAMESTFDSKTSWFPKEVNPKKIFYENIGTPTERERFKDKDFLFTGLPYLNSISDNWLNVMSLMYKYKREFPQVIKGKQLSWSWFISEDVIKGNELHLYFNNLGSYQSFMKNELTVNYLANNDLMRPDSFKIPDYKHIIKAFIYKSYGKKLAIKYYYRNNKDKAVKNDQKKYFKEILTNDRVAYRKIQNEFGYSMFDKKNMQKINSADQEDMGDYESFPQHKLI